MNLEHLIGMDRDIGMLTSMTMMYGEGDDLEYGVENTSFPVLEVNIELNFPIWPYHGVEDRVPSELKIYMSGCMRLYFNYEQGPAV